MAIRCASRDSHGARGTPAGGAVIVDRWQNPSTFRVIRMAVRAYRPPGSLDCRCFSAISQWHGCRRHASRKATEPAVSRDYIDFISAYCDRWCERCAFTSRCSAYAIEVATAMCGGDFEAGLELAVGRAATPDEGPQPRPDFDPLIEEPSEAELARFRREEDARAERVGESHISTMATIAGVLAHRWLDDHRERVVAGADIVVRDAIETIAWDCYLIAAKLHRALRGRDAAERGEEWADDDHPVQNDWNGSAKVALISIERSLIAWETIAKATGDSEAAQQADRLVDLRDAVDLEFPDARKFVRPGFDDGRRRLSKLS